MDAKELPLRPDFDQYRKQVKAFLKALNANDSNAVGRLRRFHPRCYKLTEPTLTDAQLVLARQHSFESWPKFAKYVQELARANSPFAEFERAVEAVINGDVTTLRQLLHANSTLVHARSPREHHATLLHYVSGNGVEDYRQKTSKNAVEIATTLLDAGAEVDAVANAYGNDTTLGLAATSIHPLRAGVLIPLLEVLLARGASINGAPEGLNTVNACLANGRKLGSEFIASRGGTLDLEGAAGVGRIDLVKSFFNEDGSRKPNATKAQMESGFIWACEYGRAEVADYLIRMGVDKNTCRQHKLTGLHWAAAGGDFSTVKAVLRHNPPLEALNVWGGTPLESAIWAATASDLNGAVSQNPDWLPVIEALLQAGANVHAVCYPTGEVHIDNILRRYRTKEPT